MGHKQIASAVLVLGMSGGRRRARAGPAQGDRRGCRASGRDEGQRRPYGRDQGDPDRVSRADRADRVPRRGGQGNGRVRARHVPARAAVSRRAGPCRRSTATKRASRRHRRRPRSSPRQLVDAAKGGDAKATLAAFAALGKEGCGGCHQTFRKKEQLRPVPKRGCLLALAVLFAAPAAARADADQLARGELLFHIGGCTNCHTAKDGPTLAGGDPIATPFGSVLRPEHHAGPRHRDRCLVARPVRPCHARRPGSPGLAALSSVSLYLLHPHERTRTSPLSRPIWTHCQP